MWRPDTNLDFSVPLLDCELFLDETVAVQMNITEVGDVEGFALVVPGFVLFGGVVYHFAISGT